MARMSFWNWDNNWAQHHAINELDEELSDLAVRQNRRIHQNKREFDQGLKKVDHQIGSVSRRLETILEWTELRFQLLEFDEYGARKQIRRAFRALAEGMPASAPKVGDIPGYWMPPAAGAMLRFLLREGAADLNTGLETARERDPIRSELFSLCVGLCFDQPTFTEVAVLRLLGEAPDLGLAEPGEVAAVWRSVWEHAVRGGFGPSAADLIHDRLRSVFDPVEVEDSERRAWHAAVRDFGPGGQDEPAALRALAEHLKAASGVESDHSGVAEEPWRLHLQELIEEPSPAELPLVQEMEELHLPEDGLQRSEPTWAASAGTVAELLRRDLFDPEGHPALRASALRLCAPLLRSAVESVVSEAVSSGPVTRTVKRLGGIAVEVGADGYDRAAVESAERTMASRGEMTGPSRAVMTGASAALGALAVLSAASGSWFLAVVFALAVAVPVWLYARARSERMRQQEYADSQIKAFRAALDQARKEVRDEERSRRERDAALRRAGEELIAALP